MPKERLQLTDYNFIPSWIRLGNRLDLIKCHFFPPPGTSLRPSQLANFLQFLCSIWHVCNQDIRTFVSSFDFASNDRSDTNSEFTVEICHQGISRIDTFKKSKIWCSQTPPLIWKWSATSSSDSFLPSVFVLSSYFLSRSAWCRGMDRKTVLKLFFKRLGQESWWLN